MVTLALMMVALSSTKATAEAAGLGDGSGGAGMVLDAARSRARMVDVARRAEVATVTVSRVLHEPEKVATATRARVEAAIAELGYLPNLVARSLAAARTGIVAALIPTIDNSLHAEMVQAMDQRCAAAGLHLLIGCTGFSLETEERLIGAFLARRPEAVYLTGITHTPGARRMLLASGVPVVEVANLPEQPIDMAVGYSSYAGASAMLRHLIERGHRRIGYIYSPIGDNDRLFDRYRAYHDTLAASGLATAADSRQETALSLAGGAQAIAQLLARQPAIEAVFCSTDVLAVGVLLECLRRGIRVPAELAVAGFDDLPIAAEIVPALTTVQVPRRRMGELAAELILQRMRGEPIDSHIIDVGFELQCRASA